MSAGERPGAPPDDGKRARPLTGGSRTESSSSMPHIVRGPRPEQNEGFGDWEPTLRAGQVPSDFRPAKRRGKVRRFTSTAIVVVVAGLVVAAVVQLLAELIDILS